MLYINYLHISTVFIINLFLEIFGGLSVKFSTATNFARLILQHLKLKIFNRRKSKSDNEEVNVSKK